VRGHWALRDGARYGVDPFVELRADFCTSWEKLALPLGATV
jgi:hypothetical protein